MPVSYAKALRGALTMWPTGRRGVPRLDLKALSAELESTVGYLANSRDRLVVMKLMDFPVLRSLWIYHPTGVKWVAWAPSYCSR